MWKIILSLKINFYSILLLLGSVFLFSCGEREQVAEEQKDMPKVAKVGDEVLYEFELAKMLKGEQGKDSTLLRERFINNWIRKQMLLQKAKLNLSEREQDIEKMVKEYRESLLINQYKQMYLAEHLDTSVTDEEVEQYINEHSDRFILKESVYQYYLAKVLSKNKKDVYFIYNLFSKNEVNLMQDFNLSNTSVITANDVDWYSEGELLSSLPQEVGEKHYLWWLKEGQVAKFTSKDKETTYLLKVLKKVKKGKVSPKGYVEKNVRKIILHNRKLALAQQLEYEIYEDAKNKKQFEVY